MTWQYLVIGSVLGRFNEELISRGQLLVALRSRFGENRGLVPVNLAVLTFSNPNRVPESVQARVLELATS